MQIKSVSQSVISQHSVCFDLTSRTIVSRGIHSLYTYTLLDCGITCITYISRSQSPLSEGLPFANFFPFTANHCTSLFKCKLLKSLFRALFHVILDLTLVLAPLLHNTCTFFTQLFSYFLKTVIVPCKPVALPCNDYVVYSQPLQRVLL